MDKKKSFRNVITGLLFAVPFLIMASLFLPDTVVDRAAREKALCEECRKNLPFLASLCTNYARCCKGDFPADVMQGKSVAERMKNQGFVTDPRHFICPAVSGKRSKKSFFFLPGIRLGMSPKMPCAIEAITNHDRMIGVIYVDGTFAQLPHECQNYSELIRLFPEITPAEKQLLETDLKRLDIPR